MPHLTRAHSITFTLLPIKLDQVLLRSNYRSFFQANKTRFNTLETQQVDSIGTWKLPWEKKTPQLVIYPVQVLLLHRQLPVWWKPSVDFWAV